MRSRHVNSGTETKKMSSGSLQVDRQRCIDETATSFAQSRPIKHAALQLVRPTCRPQRPRLAEIYELVQIVLFLIFL